MCKKECQGCILEQQKNGAKVRMKIIKVRKLSMGGDFVEICEEAPDV